MEDSNEDLRAKLKQQLEKSGISSVVRTMVQRICSDMDNLQEVNLDEVVHEVYKQGGMEDFFENLSRGGSRWRLRQIETQLDSLDIEGIFAKHPSLSAQNLDDYEEDIIDERLRKSGKYYLKMQIVGGKAFLDHLVGENGRSPGIDAAPASYFKSDHFTQLGANSQKSKLTLHVFYKSQRFSTKPVMSCCDPDFKETFLIEIGRFGELDGSLAAKELLSINEPLRIVVVREDVNNRKASGTIPVAYCRHDWRTILIKENGFKNFSLELMGIGPEHNVCVGILRVRFTLIPLPHERISENAYLDKANEDAATQEDFERFIITIARRWWKEYIEIRADHQFRLVRLFAYDENMVARPVTTFIKPIRLNDLLVTPFQAAWFVALLRTTNSNCVKASDNIQEPVGKRDKFKTLPGIQNGTGGCVLSERWQSVEMTIVSKSGTVEDHAVLLASLFLSFGLDAFVALGTKKGKGSWAWTVTLSENQEPTFWESTTGEYYDHFSSSNDTGSCGHQKSDVLARLAKNNVFGFLTISCLFNRKGFYANVQPTLLTDCVDWNLENPSKWKLLTYSNNESTRVSQYPIPLQTSTVNWEFTTKTLEFELKSLLITVRKEKGKSTKWNEELSQYMGQHLYREEMELTTGGTNFTDYFRTVALKMLPPGHEFRAHTFHSQLTEAHVLFSKALREPLASEIIFPSGDSVRHALKVKTFPYPEDVASIRFMIACTYIPV